MIKIKHQNNFFYDRESRNRYIAERYRRYIGDKVLNIGGGGANT